MKLNLTLLSLAASLATHASLAQTPIAVWTFDTTAPTTAGPISPEQGAGFATGYHSSTATYSSPVGNGSSHSFSVNTWSLNDYWQFQISSAGYQSLDVTYDQISSSTGPRDFTFSYSTDGTHFTTAGSAYSVLVNAAPNTWSSTGAHNSSSSFHWDLSAISALNDTAAVYLRITDASTTSAGGATVQAAGTDRVDNFTVTGFAVPEPSALALFGVGGLAVAGLIRRRA